MGGGEGMDWIDQAQGRERWRALADVDREARNITHTQTIILIPDYFMDII